VTFVYYRHDWTRYTNCGSMCVMDNTWEAAQAARIGKEVQRLRGRRTAAWLSSRAEELGLRLTRQTITDLENGRRRYVTTAELAVLAAALDTTPVALAYPGPYGDDETIEVLPGVQIPKQCAVQWFSGLFGAVTDMGDPDRFQQNTRQLRSAQAIWDLEERLRNVVIPTETGPRKDQALELAEFLQRQIDELKAASGA